jgi:hypothetical protein
LSNLQKVLTERARFSARPEIDRVGCTLPIMDFDQVFSEVFETDDPLIL